MKTHQVCGTPRNPSQSGKPNLNYVRRKLPVRKVDVDAVPAIFHADMVSRNGRTSWAGFDGERVVVIAASADEARREYQTWEARQPLAERIRLQGALERRG